MKKMRSIFGIFLILVLLATAVSAALNIYQSNDRTNSEMATLYSTPILSNLATEEVKCIFETPEGMTTGTQTCYSEKGSCTGEGTCVIKVTGKKGEIVTWKSTCGGYVHTTIDGENEYAKFKCEEPTIKIPKLQPLQEPRPIPLQVPGEYIKETVKCVFRGPGATKSQRCYSDKGECTSRVYGGYGACTVDIEGKKGEKVTWKSTCGGYATTIIDGENEPVEFKCGEIIKEGDFYKAYWSCYDEYSVYASTKNPLTSDAWRKYADRSCENHCYAGNCGVKEFTVLR